MKLRRSRPQGDPVAMPALCRRTLGGRLEKVAAPVLALALAASVGGCVDDADDTDGLPTGPPDNTPVATRYGALGNSLTAGFINGGLVQGGQVASYPVVLAGQAGWESPEIPTIARPGIGSTPGQSPLMVTPEGGLGSEPIGSPLELLRNATLPRPYDNLGVPGATTKDLLDATDALTSQAGTNSFFDLILRNSVLPPFGHPRTVLDQMEDRNPNVLTLWIGNNDILGGALGGNPVVGANITPPQIWEQLFAGVLARVDAMNPSYVAVANIPNIVDIPYVTTIPYEFPFGDGSLPFNTEEEDVEYVLLPFGLLAASNPDTLGTFLSGFGTNSIPSIWTLTASEAQAITETAAAYNTIIESACSARGWAYVDISSELAALPKSVLAPRFDVINGLFPWFPVFGSGGVSFVRNELAAFSLDGIHPSELGSSVLANAFARSLSAAYADLDIPERELSTVENLTGFENAPSGDPRPSGTTTNAGVSQEARRTVEAIPALLGIAQ